MLGITSGAKRCSVYHPGDSAPALGDSASPDCKELWLFQSLDGLSIGRFFNSLEHVPAFPHLRFRAALHRGRSETQLNFAQYSRLANVPKSNTQR